ncbi:hypothetical protein [Pseudarthrobacter sp. S9]|uniref:hypothetical protein n=1 Tax=Pseudarthrobacter sp. S9 TaxID=3418421 RepID=UPI003CFD4E60
MSEVATLNQVGALSTPGHGLPQTAAVIQLHEWAAELAAAHQLGRALAMSSFLPMGLRKKGKDGWKNQDELTNDAAAIILAGKSVGLDPMQSVQNIFPVHGMPSMYARTMVALVLAQGHDCTRTEATNQSVTYKARRKGDADWQYFTWDMARARKAGYTSNAKYESDPIAMLGAKSAAEACRVVFPDVLLGMAYSVEELELEDLGESPDPAPSSAEAPKAKRTIQRAKAPTPALPDVVHDAPQDDLEESLPAEPEPILDPITTAQLTKLNIVLQEQGLTERDDKLKYLSTYLERPINSSRDLTKAEAHRLIDEHETDAA